MTPTSYRIKSVNTRWYPINEGATPNGVVKTQDGANSVPSDSILKFSKPVQNHNVILSVAGTHGLYIGLPDHAEDGTKLIWTSKPFDWEIVPTIDAEGKTTHQIIPANGADLYVIDEFGIGPVFIVKPGSKIVAPQSYFTITPA